MFRGATGCIVAGAGIIVMPLVGIGIGLCIVGTGSIIAAISAGQAEHKAQAEKMRKLGQYPSYKY